MEIQRIPAWKDLSMDFSKCGESSSSPQPFEQRGHMTQQRWRPSQTAENGFQTEKHTWSYIPRAWLNSSLAMIHPCRPIRCGASSSCSRLPIGSRRCCPGDAALSVPLPNYTDMTRHEEVTCSCFSRTAVSSFWVPSEVNLHRRVYLPSSCWYSPANYSFFILKQSKLLTDISELRLKVWQAVSTAPVTVYCFKGFYLLQPQPLFCFYGIWQDGRRWDTKRNKRNFVGY